MREIKFRVWDNGAKMYQQMSAMMNVHTGHISDLPERHTIEQFTGLHDMFGRPIYEGDIIKKIRCNTNIVIKWVQNICGFEGMYPDGSFCVLNILSAPEMQVIGNIHEKAPTSV